MTIARTETRDNKVYIVMSGFDWENPRIMSSFYETNGNPELIPTGSIVEEWNGVYLYKSDWKTISFYAIDKYPAFTEFTPVKPPRKTGYKWHDGNWIKTR